MEWILLYIKGKGVSAEKIVVYFNNISKMTQFWIHSQSYLKAHAFQVVNRLYKIDSSKYFTPT